MIGLRWSLVALGCLVIGAATGCDVDPAGGTPALNAIARSEAELDDVQAAALQGLFARTDEIAGDVPSKGKYFAIELLDGRVPDEGFLRRLEGAKIPLVTLAEGKRHEPNERSPEAETAGWYLTIDRVQWTGAKRAAVQVMVGNGWAAVVYEMQVANVDGQWQVASFERIAIS